MKKLGFLLTVIFCLFFYSFSQAKPLRERVGKRLIEKSKVKKSEDLLPKGGKLIADLAYGASPDQMMDIYLPSGKPRSQVLFMVHGGAWEFGDRKGKKFIKNKIQRWVPKGYIVISVGYRLIPNAGPLEQANDVAAALGFAQQKVKEWGADPNQFILLGHSSGAHLISLISAAAGNQKLSAAGALDHTPSAAVQLNLQFSPALAIIVLDSAVFNAPKLMMQKHAGLYDKALGLDPNLWQRLSPLHQLVGKVPPFYIVCSKAREDSCSQGEEFVRKLKSLGGQAELNQVNLSHSEINEQLGLVNTFTRQVEKFLKSMGLKL
jgi:acetyl esterase/lipase